MSLLLVFGGLPQELTTLLALFTEPALHGEKTTLLLLSKACTLAGDMNLCRRLRRLGISLCAVKEDLEAEKLSESTVSDVEVVDYDGWVRLLEEHNKVVSWI